MPQVVNTEPGTVHRSKTEASYRPVEGLIGILVSGTGPGIKKNETTFSFPDSPMQGFNRKSPNGETLRLPTLL